MLQCDDHHQPVGTAYGERYAGIHPHRAEAERTGRQGESAPAIAQGGYGTAREAARSNDYGGVWNTLQGSEHGKHSERIPPRLPGQEKVCPDKAGRGGVHQPGGLAHLG